MKRYLYLEEIKKHFRVHSICALLDPQTIEGGYMKQKIFEKILDWSKAQDAIRALILIGSYAGKEKTDEHSDYDISIFTNDV
jgi:hypothetical protein